MRWKSKHIRAFNHGEEVSFERFLLFPKRIKGEWRWLEKAKYQARAYHSCTGMMDEWTNERWVD